MTLKGNRLAINGAFKMAVIQWIFRLAWTGICALSMLAQTRLLLGQPLAPDWLDGFVMGGAVFAYGFTHPERRLRTAARLAGVFGAGCFFLSLLTIAPGDFFRQAYWQTAALLPLLAWLLYYGMKRPGNAGLRAVPIAKPIVVAFSWAWVTVALPLPPERWAEAVFIFPGRASFIFALALAYDLADLEYDRRHGLATLAGRLGITKTFYLIYSALAVAALCCCANFSLRIYGLNMALALLASLAFSAWWLRLSLQKAHWHFWQKVLIDGLMLLQFLMILGVKYL